MAGQFLTLDNNEETHIIIYAKILNTKVEFNYQDEITGKTILHHMAIIHMRLPEKRSSHIILI